MLNKPLNYLDNNNDFSKAQRNKINSLLKSEYNRFVDKSFQKQLDEDNGSVAVDAKTDRVLNCTSIEYNGIGFASFQLFLLGVVAGDTIAVINVTHEVTSSIESGGSSYEEMYDDVADYGYFSASGNTIYFTMTHDPETLIFPQVNLCWSYKEE